jgi:hypothetical protein
LRNEKYSSAAEISILRVESRIRRISPAFARVEEVEKRRKSASRAEFRRLGMVFGPIWQEPGKSVLRHPSRCG